MTADPQATQVLMMGAPSTERPWRRRIFLSLGSNRGDRVGNVRAALDALAGREDLRVDAVASLRETAPVGVTDQPSFVNTVCMASTRLPPEALLVTCQRIERRLGRDRLREDMRWGPRVIDIDVIFYDDVVVNSPVIHLPHPRYRERGFVLEPLLEIAPDATDPLTGTPLREFMRPLAETEPPGKIVGLP